MRGVVDLARALHRDREAEAVDRATARRPQAVHGVGRDVHEIPRADGPVLVADRHDASAGHHEVELVRRVLVREHRAARGDLELVDQLE